jgi:hypothetical protein
VITADLHLRTNTILSTFSIRLQDDFIHVFNQPSNHRHRQMNKGSLKQKQQLTY